MSARKHNYVVGFTGNEQVAYGRDGSIKLFTQLQAKKEVKTLMKPYYSKLKRTIYKLVAVQTID